MLLEKSRKSFKRNEEAEPKQKQCPVVDVSDGRSKVWCCKEQYCIGIWNVRSLNQGKLEVVKQEMARMNINIWGINELKWTRLGELDSDDIISTTVGKNPLEEKELTSYTTKESKMQYLGVISEKTEWSLFISKEEPFSITVIQVYVPNTNAEEGRVDLSMKIYQTF